MASGRPPPMTPEATEGALSAFGASPSSAGQDFMKDGLKLCLGRLTEMSKHMTLLDKASMKHEDIDMLEQRFTKLLEDRVQEVRAEMLERLGKVDRSLLAVQGRAAEAPGRAPAPAPAPEPRAEAPMVPEQSKGPGHGTIGVLSSKIASLERTCSDLQKAIGRKGADKAEDDYLHSIDELVGRMTQLEKDVRRTKRSVTNLGPLSLAGGRSSEQAGKDVPVNVDDTPKGIVDPYSENEASVDAGESFEFAESVWDASFFAFHPIIGTGESFHLVLLLFLNLLTIAIFIVITYLSLAQEAYTGDDIEGYKIWRRNIGHNVKYYDKLTFTSLTERMCLQDPKYPVEMSDGKSGDLDGIVSWLPDFDTHGPVAIFFSGPMLVFVALMAWCMTVLEEFKNVTKAFGAMMKIRKGRCTVIAPTGDGGVEITQAGYMRTTFFFFILLIRLTCAVLLWHGGMLFITNFSLNLGDIILNTVALEVVLNVDQAFFNLVSARLQNVIGKVRPLVSTRNRCNIGGLDMRAMFWGAWLVVSLVVVMTQDVLPLMDRITQVKDAMCGGNTSFVYALDPYYVPYVSHSNPTGESASRVNDYPHIHAIDELIYPDRIPTQLWFGVPERAQIGIETVGQGVDAVLRVSSMTTGEATDNLQDLADVECKDTYSQLLSLNRFTTLLMQEHGVKMTRCSDIADHCFGTNSLPRVACPTTCGCDSPSSSLLLAHPVDGCPTSCAGSQWYQASLASLACAEKGVAELQTDARWLAFAKQFGVKTDKLLADERYKAEKAMLCSAVPGDCEATFKTLGCGIVGAWKTQSKLVFGTAHSLCVGDYFSKELKLRPLAIVCPVTCGCSDPAVTAAEKAAMSCPGAC